MNLSIKEKKIILNALNNVKEYTTTHDKLIGKLMKKEKNNVKDIKEYYSIPCMTVHRDDISLIIGEKKAKKITNKKMQNIADNMSEPLSQDWTICLKEALQQEGLLK